MLILIKNGYKFYGPSPSKGDEEILYRKCFRTGHAIDVYQHVLAKEKYKTSKDFESFSIETSYQRADGAECKVAAYGVSRENLIAKIAGVEEKLLMETSVPRS